VNSTDQSITPMNNLQYLPAYASFLLAEKLDDYCRYLLAEGSAMDIPMMKFFQTLPETEQQAFIRQSVTELFTFLSQNKAAEYITLSNERWKANHLPFIQRDAVAATDLTRVQALRKKCLVHFISHYTNQPAEILNLINDIDLFVNENLTISTNTYMELLKEKLQDHTHFIQKVTETIPGAIHVFDAVEYKGVYSNKKLPAVIGYTQEELNDLGTGAIAMLIHPDDQEKLHEQRKLMQNANDGEVNLCKYRVKTRDGTYRWLAAYEAVFRRADDGSVKETIGITLNIDNEQNALQENQSLIKSLSRSEALYRKAEEIANMGNWVWYVKKDKLEWTDHLYRIYGLEPQSEVVTIDRFLSLVHPDDRDFVQQGIDKLYSENGLDYTFRIITPAGTVKWLRSIAHVIRGKDGNVSTVVGIEQDVTERQKLIGRLEESQQLYKQAQELARMGNFSWDLHSGEVFWSDEVYKIYERPFGQPVKFDDAFAPVVPEYRERVQAAITNVLSTRQGESVSYPIRLKNNVVKYVLLHTDVRLNNSGDVGCIVGTVQDITDKEVLIERLQQSEKLYKQAQALAHMGNWVYDLQDGTIVWSDELYKIYETTNGRPLTPEQWRTYLEPEEMKRIDEQFEQALTEKKPIDVIHSIRLPSGRKKVLHRRGEVLFNDSGKPTKVVGTTQDVTEHFRVQAELEESQTFIRKITDATPSIIATYNVHNGKYTFISEGVEKLLGYKTTEVLAGGLAFLAEKIHPDDIAMLTEKNSMALEKAATSKPELVMEFTYRIRHKNGEYRWLHTYGTVFDFNQKGQVENVLNISLDVTEQKEATEKIKEQEHFIQQIADASPTILYLFDVSSQSMAYINREAFFVLGYLPDEILEEGSGITDFLYHPEDIDLLPCRRQSKKVFQQVDSMIQYECRMKHKDGDYRWLLVREIVFKSGEDGSIRQIIGAALDINRRKEMERTILQNTLQLEQSNASLEEFAYVASHDLKEPLRKISTFGDRLVASQLDRLSDDGKIYLRKIVDASQRMQNMISDLLSISMISGNRAFETYSLQRILEETVQTLEFKIENQQAVIRYDQLPEANIIPSQFRQLFQNLLSNSLKFVREGVQPLITIRCTEADPYEAAPYQLARAEKYLKILFSDNGIGFENEYAQKIFAIFQRLHGRSEYEGSGIGLSICKKIVEHHRGVIFAQGEPGVGATFTIILPA
jgi:PAS domain S-box-containing protein